jgi:hypothetical protein
MNTHTALLLLLLTCSSAYAGDDSSWPPRRASGLWEITPTTSPFSWSFCALTEKDHLVEDDLWSNFDKECELQSQDREGSTYRFVALCDKKTTRLTGTIEGDLSTEYVATTVASFKLLDGTESARRDVVKGKRVGDCPTDLPPGTKKMKGGLILRGFYDKRQ